MTWEHSELAAKMLHPRGLRAGAGCLGCGQRDRYQDSVTVTGDNPPPTGTTLAD